MKSNKAHFKRAHPWEKFYFESKLSLAVAIHKKKNFLKN